MAIADALRWMSLEDVVRAAQAFLDPVLADKALPNWSPQRWTWEW